jgi:hypothetical protein
MVARNWTGCCEHSEFHHREELCRQRWNRERKERMTAALDLIGRANTGEATKRGQ